MLSSGIWTPAEGQQEDKKRTTGGQADDNKRRGQEEEKTEDKKMTVKLHNRRRTRRGQQADNEMDNNSDKWQVPICGYLGTICVVLDQHFMLNPGQPRNEKQY